MECDLGNIKVYYEARGEGKPILFLHGFGVSASHLEWLELVESHFQERDGWQRFYVDLPGMGNTPGADWIKNSEDVIDILLKFIQQVVPDQKITLAGYSYGGYLSQGIVYKNPDIVNGLCLVAPVTREASKRSLPKHHVVIKNEELIQELNSEEAEFFQNFFVIQNRKLIDRAKKWFKRPVLGDEKFLAQLNEKNNYIPFDVEKLPKLFEFPSLIITGRQDAITGYQQPMGILQNYPQATFAVLDRAGHGLIWEQEKLIISFIGEWLDRVEENINLNS